jgi:hypothetical protein
VLRRAALDGGVLHLGGYVHVVHRCKHVDRVRPVFFHVKNRSKWSVFAR